MTASVHTQHDEIRPLFARDAQDFNVGFAMGGARDRWAVVPHDPWHERVETFDGVGFTRAPELGELYRLVVRQLLEGRRGRFGPRPLEDVKQRHPCPGFLGEREGEFQSAEKLGQAADIIAAHPVALQLRNLQVLTEIAAEKNSTIVFPSQFMDTVSSLKSFMSKEVK